MRRSSCIHGDVAPALVTATSEEPASAPDAPAAEGPIGPIAELPDERFIPLSMPKEQRAAISLDEAPAVDLALHPDNFITSEPEIAAIIAAAAMAGGGMAGAAVGVGAPARSRPA
jgi:hypothetical protein